MENFVVATHLTNLLAPTLFITRRYYDSINGYVDISIPQALVVDMCSSVTQGQMVFTAAQNDTVVLTVTRSGTYQLEIDADGNGGPDSAQTGTWSSFLAAS